VSLILICSLLYRCRSSPVLIRIRHKTTGVTWPFLSYILPAVIIFFWECMKWHIYIYIYPSNSLVYVTKQKGKTCAVGQGYIFKLWSVWVFMLYFKCSLTVYLMNNQWTFKVLPRVFPEGTTDCTSIFSCKRIATNYITQCLQADTGLMSRLNTKNQDHRTTKNQEEIKCYNTCFNIAFAWLCTLTVR
jgi:hypothetical protein